MKRTPLHASHQQLGAKLIEFGGWEMPVYYTSIIDEHQAVRNAAGLFDISHMGEFRARGPGAEAFLNRVLTNDARKLSPGQGQYTLLCNENGGTIDDLYAYRLGDEDFLLIVNASRIDADFQWLAKQLGADKGVELKNESDACAAVAVQGPAAAQFIDACVVSSGPGPSSLRKNEIARHQFSGEEALVSRTGYTGEDGFEIVVPASAAVSLWNRILEAGKPFGIKPAGLGARDTLRTEACYPLYGNELDENTTPLEAGVGFFVALDKGDFTGRGALAKQKAAGLRKKLVAFKMTERTAPPRPHYKILSGDSQPQAIGDVTSGTQSPTLGIGIGLGYVPAACAAPNTPIAIEIRGKPAPAVIVPKPFYKRR